MSAVTMAWYGSRLESQSLLDAIAHNCECEFGLTGNRLSTCGAHQMLLSGQRARNGLLFGRHLSARLKREEFTPDHTCRETGART